MVDAAIILGIDGRPAQQGAGQVKQSLDGVKQSATGMAGAFDRLRDNVFSLRGAFNSLAAALSIRSIIQASDTYKSLTARLSLVTKGVDDLRIAQTKLFNISQQTRSSFDANTQLYIKLAQATKTLGLSQDQLMTITKTVAQGFQISGASATETASAVRQLSQAFASGVLRGDEFNSIMENAPRLQQALATSLGVTTGQLRQMAEKGQLDVRKLSKALLDQAGIIDKEFARLPLTVGGALQQISNAFLKYIGQSSAIAEGTNAIALALSSVADNFDSVANTVLTLAAIYTARFLPILAAQAIAWAKNTVQIVLYEIALARLAIRQNALAGTMSILNVAMGGLLTGVLLLGTGLYIWGDKIDDAASKGNRFAEALKVIKDNLMALGSYVADTFLSITDKLAVGIAGTLEATGLAGEGYARDVWSMQQGRNRPSAPAGPNYGAAGAAAAALGKTSPGAGGGGTADKTKALEKYNEKLRESLQLATAERAAAMQSDRERSISKALVEAEAAARDDVNKGLRASATLRPNEIKYIRETAGATYDMVEALRKEDAARDKLKGLIESTRTPVEQLKHDLGELEKLKPFAKTPEEVEALRREMERLQDQVNPMAEIFKETANSIRDSFRDAIRGMLDGSGGFKDIKAKLIKLFKDMLADMVTLSIASPIIVPIVTGIGGSLGMSQSSLSAVATQLGGSSLNMASGAGSIFSGLMNGFNTPIFSPTSMIGSGIDSIGKFLGIGGQMAQGPNLVGGAGYQLGLSSNFTPLSGIAGIGGGLLSSMVFGGGIGNTIGSTIGGIAGTALGPIGALAGSFLGGALGSLFGGGKPSSKLQGGIVDLASGDITDRYGLTGKKFSQENFDRVTSLASLSSAVAQVISGGSFTGKLAINASDRYGLQYGFGTDPEKDIKNSFDTIGQYLEAFSKDIVGKADKVSDSIKTAIEHIDFAKTEQALADLDFAAKFDYLDRAPEKVSALSAALAKAASTAERLGLSVDKVNAAFKAQFDTLIGSNILSIINPGASATVSEISRYQQDRADALAVGGDLQQVELLHKIKLLQIEQQYGTVQQENLQRLQATEETTSSLIDSYRNISESLGDTISKLRLGDSSSLSPRQKLAEAERIYNDLLARSRLGDVDAQGKVGAAGQDYLALYRKAFASSQSYDIVFDKVTKELGEVKDVADRQIVRLDGILSNTREQITATQNGFSALQTEIEKLTKPQAGASTAGISENYAGGSFSAGNPNEVVLKNLDAIKSAGLYTSVEALLSQFTPGVVSGGGRRSAFFETNPFYANLFRQQAHALGIPGFATGGSFMVGGSGGIDSQFVKFMATPGEMVHITKPGQASNDNGGVEKRLDQLTQVVAKVGGNTNQKLGAAVKRLDRLETSQRMKA